MGTFRAPFVIPLQPCDTLAGLKSAKHNKAEIGKPIAEYMLVRDGIGNVEKSSFNCLTGALQR
ncbi:TPA: hypothetical protein ACF3U9_000127 [Vibrio parahaemolyticus]